MHTIVLDDFIFDDTTDSLTESVSETSPLGYTINFEEETISIKEGYEIYTAETEGDKIQSGDSITAYIGQSLYIQESSSSMRTAISIPARPSAPSLEPNVKITASSITILPVDKEKEYRIYPSNGEPGPWSTLTVATDDSYTWEDLQPGTEYTIETRTQASKYSENFASRPASITVTTDRTNSTLTVEPTENTLTYGETLTIKVTPSIKEQTAANALTTAENTVELINAAGDVLATATQPDDDGAYTLTYNTQGKGLAPSQNTLTVSFGGSGSLKPSTAQVTVTLKKANVNATLDGTTSKTYDGTIAAPEGLTIALIGVLEGDDVTAAGTIAYDTKDVGDNRTITASNLTLTGTDAGYYNLMSNDTEENTGSITAAALSGTLTITGTAQYEQQLTASYDPVHDDEQVTYQWNRGGQPITGATGGTYTLTEADIGQSITVTVTATDSNHTGSVTSNSVQVGISHEGLSFEVNRTEKILTVSDPIFDNVDSDNPFVVVIPEEYSHYALILVDNDVEKLAEKGAELIIQREGGISASYDAKTISSLANNHGNLKFEAIDNISRQGIFTVNVYGADSDLVYSKVHNLGGAAVISFAYQLTGDLTPDTVAVFCIDGGGRELMDTWYSNGVLSFRTTHHSDYEIGKHVEPDPVLPPVWGGDDEYIPLPPQIVYEDDGSEDMTTAVACAAAAVVAAILACFLIVEYRRK